jgi:putative ABC transport system permease protein
VLSVALGVGLISAVLVLQEETRARFEEEGKIFDLVVGAKGSPLQLVLSSIYFMDNPTGAIWYSDYERLLKDEDVANAYPIGLGDTYKGYRIVGTLPEIFDYTWTDTYGRERRPFQLSEGRRFQAPMEAVLGGLAAGRLGLKVGDTFVGVHGTIELPEEAGGMSHAHEPYKVVGILKTVGTSVDRAIFTNIDSVWNLHAHAEHEYLEENAMKPPVPNDRLISAVLVSLHSPALQFTFERRINNDYNAMAARPTSIIAKLFDQFLGRALSVLVAVGFLVVVVSALSIMIGLYLSIYQRKRDLAIMRALGASSVEIVGGVLIEAFLVTVIGIVAGWLLGAVITFGAGVYVSHNFGMVVHPFAWSRLMTTAYSVVAIVGLLAGILPAVQAYRTDVARDLAAI